MTPNTWADAKRKELQALEKMGIEKLLVFIGELLIDISNEVSQIERNTEGIEVNTS